MVGFADEDLARRTDQLVLQAAALSTAAVREADLLDRAIEDLRDELWGGGR